jgi:hypothetical protein
MAEFNACIEAGNIAVVFGLKVEAWGNSSVVARENSSVVARENSSVVAWENSSVVAWGNSSVVAWGNSSVEAWENSSVEAWGNSFIRLFSASKVKASAFVAIYMHGKAQELEGGRQLEVAPPPKTPEEWAESQGVEVKNGHVTLYKGVDDEYSTDNARRVGLYYKVGQEVAAPDWDAGKKECGGGLHFSPRASMTLEFKGDAKHFLAVRVALADMRSPADGDEYPQKCKARACKVLAEVDRRGRAI